MACRQGQEMAGAFRYLCTYEPDQIYHHPHMSSGHSSDLPSIVAVGHDDLRDRFGQDQYASHLVQRFMHLILRKKVGEGD